MRAAVSTMLALMFGGGVSLLAGSAASAPARAAAPQASPRTAVATTVGATADCTIFSGSKASATQCGGGSDNLAGTDGNGNFYRAMVAFASGLDIPAGATVISATLTIQVLGAFGSTDATVLPMSRAFTPGAATWNTYDGVHPWSTGGGDYNANPHVSETVSAAGTVSFSIPSLIQPWVDGSDPIRQLMILGFTGTGNVFSFGNRASGNGPVLSVTYQPPPPPPPTTTPTSPTTPTTPPTTGPVVTTPLPVAHGVRALRIKALLSWTWNGAAIRLRKVKVGSMPGDTKLRMGCQGGGCPRHSANAVSGARKVRRALLRMAGRRYRAGDVLSLKLTAAGYRQERARIFFRNGKQPLVLG